MWSLSAVATVTRSELNRCSLIAAPIIASKQVNDDGNLVATLVSTRLPTNDGGDGDKLRRSTTNAAVHDWVC
jgi:hypothetical protein